jgi:hypothetical protein
VSAETVNTPSGGARITSVTTRTINCYYNRHRFVIYTNTHNRRVVRRLPARYSLDEQSSLAIATRLRAGRPRKQGSIPSRGGRYYLIYTLKIGSGACAGGTATVSRQRSDREWGGGGNLTTHIHVAPKLRRLDTPIRLYTVALVCPMRHTAQHLIPLSSVAPTMWPRSTNYACPHDTIYSPSSVPAPTQQPQ